MEPTRIVLVEDHAIVRQGLQLLIDSHTDLKVVGEASDGIEALQMVLQVRPDVVVFDISMPNMNGIEFVKKLRISDSETRLLALTANEDKAYLNELIGLGVTGYLLKRSAPTDLIEAIRITATKQRFLDPKIVHDLVDDVFLQKPTVRHVAEGTLSERELEVIRFIAQGYTNKEVASKLAISVKTVETHKARAMSKLQLQSRSELMRYALTHRWLDSE